MDTFLKQSIESYTGTKRREPVPACRYPTSLAKVGVEELESPEQNPDHNLWDELEHWLHPRPPHWTSDWRLIQDPKLQYVLSSSLEYLWDVWGLRTSEKLGTGWGSLCGRLNHRLSAFTAQDHKRRPGKNDRSQKPIHAAVISRLGTWRRVMHEAKKACVSK